MFTRRATLRKIDCNSLEQSIHASLEDLSLEFKVLIKITKNSRANQPKDISSSVSNKTETIEPLDQNGSLMDH